MKNTIAELLTVISLLFTCTTAQATLVNGTFTNGDNGVGVVNQANGMQFNLNQGTTNLNWDKFNVGASETVNYNFNAMNSTAFNQINSLNGVSTIAGKINAMGLGAATSNIILNNAAGVSFVNGSSINVGAMTVQANKPISVMGLKVFNGNLDLKTTNGRIDVKGLIFENAGNLSVEATNQIALGGIRNAANLSAKTNSSIYIKAEDYYVGKEKVSGITADYMSLTSTGNGEIRFEGGNVNVNKNLMVATKGGQLNTHNNKITVGKDFIVITAGNFVDAPGAGINTIVTNNGTYYCDGYGANTSKIENTTIANKDGVLKIFASKLDVNNSTVDNMIVSSGNFTLDNSNITNRLEIGLDGTRKNNTPTKIISSYVHDMEMEYSTLSLENSNIDNLGINDTALSYSNSVVNDNLYFTKYSDRKVSSKITSNEVNSLLGLLKDETSSLHLGYTKTMGSEYSSDIKLEGNMANANIYAATKGNVNMDITNVSSLTVEKSNNTNIAYNGELKLNNITAQNDISITADALTNAISKIGTIDSKTNSVKFNIASDSTQTGSGIDSNNRVYSIVTIGANIYDIYDGAAYMAPTIKPSTPIVPTTPSTPVVTPSTPVVTPSTSEETNNTATEIAQNTETTISNEQQNYINTLNVDNTEYNLTTTNNQLAAQFARNVKSLAADDKKAQNPELRKNNKGFSIVKSFIPALKY